MQVVTCLSMVQGPSVRYRRGALPPVAGRWAIDADDRHLGTAAASRRRML